MGSKKSEPTELAVSKRLMFLSRKEHVFRGTSRLIVILPPKKLG